MGIVDSRRWKDQGRVVDPSGASVPKATIRVMDQQSGTEAKTQTNDEGDYTVPALNQGTFKIVVEAPGFGTAVSDSISLSESQQAVLNFTLKVGPNSSDVTVCSSIVP